MMTGKNVTKDGVNVPTERLAWRLRDLAEALGTSVSFLRLEAARHKLRLARLGRRVVVPDAEVRRYLADSLEPERDPR
jgi:hypothetical protein